MSTLLNTFLSLQNNLKLYHWNTQSFARHKGSDDLSEKLAKNIDKFVELYIGRYGRFPLTKKDAMINLHIHNDKTIIPFLDNAIKFLTFDLSNYLKKDDFDLFNIRDEIIGDLNQTKYLFTLS